MRDKLVKRHFLQLNIDKSDNDVIKGLVVFLQSKDIGGNMYFTPGLRLRSFIDCGKLGTEAGRKHLCLESC